MKINKEIHGISFSFTGYLHFKLEVLFQLFKFKLWDNSYVSNFRETIIQILLTISVKVNDHQCSQPRINKGNIFCKETEK